VTRVPGRLVGADSVRDQERDQILRGSGRAMRLSGFFLTAAQAIRTLPAKRDRRKNRLSGTAKNSRQRAKASFRFALRRRASKSTRAVREMRRRRVSSLSWPPRGKSSSAQNCSVMGHIPIITSVIQRTTRAHISQICEGPPKFVLSLRKIRVAALLFAALGVCCSWSCCSWSLLLLEYASGGMKGSCCIWRRLTSATESSRLNLRDGRYCAKYFSA
jgi:hypothetical protein